MDEGNAIVYDCSNDRRLGAGPVTGRDDFLIYLSDRVDLVSPSGCAEVSVQFSILANRTVPVAATPGDPADRGRGYHTDHRSRRI